MILHILGQTYGTALTSPSINIRKSHFYLGDSYKFMRKMSAKSFAATLVGVDARIVDVEAQLVPGLKRFALVGLPDGVLKESKDRIRCAANNSGFPFPFDELVVSLSPASLPKYGSGFDLAIALSVMGAQGLITQEQLSKRVFLGELSLDGQIKPVPGVIAATAMVKDLDEWELVIPAANLHQAQLLQGVRCIGVKSIEDVIFYIRGEKAREELNEEALASSKSAKVLVRDLSFADVIGQYAAKRALEVSAAGGHNLLMVGPPGAGKSMLAERLSCLLPRLEDEEVVEIMKIHAAAKMLSNSVDLEVTQYPGERPFRAPHHTTSYAGLIGGGPNSVPGEISLAHKGVLFLDELPEFKRDVLESLRAPLETKHVIISRAKLRVKYPADFTLISAMNPCPCGKKGAPFQTCKCSHAAVLRYNARISGPFIDRLDLRIWVPALSVQELSRGVVEDQTSKMKSNILVAREVQKRRFTNTLRLNNSLSSNEIKDYCRLSATGTHLLDSAVKRFGLSARGYSRVLKVARTIADLEMRNLISDEHLAEALSYRGPELQSC